MNDRLTVAEGVKNAVPKYLTCAFRSWYVTYVETKKQGIGPRIARARGEASLTQVALAEATGHAPRAVQAWETGERHPRLASLQRVATVTGRPVSWFFEEEAA